MAFIYAGNDLLSHTLSRAVQSALRGLTSVFGMGTGGSPAVRSPTTCSSRWSLADSRWPRTWLQTFKDREVDASQLNRLGVVYFLLCLLPISTTLLRLFVGAQCQCFDFVSTQVLVVSRILSSVFVQVLTNN